VAWADPKGYHLGAEFTPLIEKADKMSDTVRELVGMTENQEEMIKGIEESIEIQEEWVEMQKNRLERLRGELRREGISRGGEEKWT